MNKEQHAAILLGLLTFEQSKDMFGLMNYEDKKNLIEAIVHLPYTEKEETIEVVSQCIELITGERYQNECDYKIQLRTIANEKPKTLARYIASLLRKTDNFYIG